MIEKKKGKKGKHIKSISGIGEGMLLYEDEAPTATTNGNIMDNIKGNKSNGGEPNGFLWNIITFGCGGTSR